MTEKSFLQLQTEALHAKREALRLAHRAELILEADKQRPLVERVRDTIATLPPQEISAGIRLERLCELIPGKHRDHAQPRAVGAALRELGYVRQRCWRKSDQGFRALWIRPNAPTPQTD